MRLIDQLASTIERAKSLDPIAKKISDLTDKAGMDTPLVRGTLSGTAIGHPLHPLMVTVPIGSWVAATVFDFLPGREKAAQTLVGLGIVAAVPTAAAGLNDWRYTDGPERRVGLVHAASNSLALSTYLASYVARRRGHQGVGVALGLMGSGFISVGGWLGGHLSYAMGVGVDTTAFLGGAKHWTAVGSRDEVRDNAMLAKSVDGVSVLLAEVDGEVVAMANRCTHRGGPLAEGKRIDDCVRCPWHHSEFALADGSVQKGPATRPEPTYDVRIVDGQIEVKRRELSSLQADSVSG